MKHWQPRSQTETRLGVVHRGAIPRVFTGVFAKLCGTAALGGAEVTNFFKSICLLLSATLREIFDESAYDRFLARTQSERSVTSYRAFTRERADGIAHKQRCC